MDDPQIYPDAGSPTGYSDINGYMVDSTGQPVNYDSSGQLIDSNGNVIGDAGTYTPTANDINFVPTSTTDLSNPLGTNTNTGSSLSSLLGLGNQVANAASGVQNALGLSNLANVGGAAYLGNAITGAGQNIANVASNVSNQYAPYTQLGYTGLNALAQQLPSLTTPFTNADLNAQLAPNYQFQLQQGLGQTANAANATGGLLSGNAQQGLQNYAQNFAGNAYQNALNNYLTQNQSIFNKLSNIAGIGSSSIGAQGQLALGGAQATGNAAVQAGQQYSQAANQLAQNQYLSALLNQKPNIPNINITNSPSVSAQGGTGGTGGAGGVSAAQGGSGGALGQASSAVNQANTAANQASGLMGTLGNIGSTVGSVLGDIGSFFGF